MTAVSPLLDAAIAASRAAEQVIRRYYQSDLAVQTKADQSPVTQADIESEQVIRDTLARIFPSHGFYGEELGRSSTGAEYVWLIDPIDGTKSFVRGYPMFSTQIALMHRGELVLGVSNAPCYAGDG
ncbi:MAG: inositol monophosphatase family protein, partial [Nevskiales bacterium]